MWDVTRCERQERKSREKYGGAYDPRIWAILSKGAASTGRTLGGGVGWPSFVQVSSPNVARVITVFGKSRQK